VRLSTAAAALPAEGPARRLRGLEREHLRDLLETRIARGHLALLARGFGILSLGPALLLSGLALGGGAFGLGFPVALLWLAATGLGLVFGVKALGAERRLRVLGSTSTIHEAPAPWWRPVEGLLLRVATLTGGVLAAEALRPGAIPGPILLKAAGLGAGAAVAVVAGLLAETRYSSRRR